MAKARAWDATKRNAHASRVADALRSQEAELSLDDRRQAVQDAVSTWAKPTLPATGGYAWCVDVFEDYVVFRTDSGDLYRVNYKLDADGKAILSGEPEKVVARTSYEPSTTSEAAAREFLGDVMEIVEAAAADGTTLIKLIQPGWGSSGYYGDKLLERDGPKAFPKGTHMYWDHPTKTEEKERPERSVRDLAAVLAEDAAYNEKGKKGPGLYAKAQVVRSYKNSITDLAPHIGVSIRALGRAAKGTVDGRTGDVISELTQGRSVDFVTRAGAGGEVVSLFEAARERAAADIVPADKAREARTVAEATELVEARRLLEEQRTRSARLQEQLAVRDAQALITEALSASKLPTICHARISEALLRDLPMAEQDYAACIAAKKADGKDDDAAKEACKGTSESRLNRDTLKTRTEKAIKDEREYIARLTGRTGDITGMGEGAATATSTTTEQDKAETSLAESMVGLFGMKPETAKRVAGRN